MLRRNPTDTLVITHPLTGESVRLTRLHLTRDITIYHPLTNDPVHLPAGTLGGWVSDEVTFDNHSFIDTGIILCGNISLTHSSLYLDDTDHARTITNRVTSGTATPKELNIVATWPEQSVMLHYSQLHAQRQLTLTGLKAYVEHSTLSGERITLTGSHPRATADIGHTLLRRGVSITSNQCTLHYTQADALHVTGTVHLSYNQLRRCTLTTDDSIGIHYSQLKDINVVGQCRLDNYDLTYPATTEQPALTITDTGTLTRLTLHCGNFEYTLPVYIHADSSTVFTADHPRTLPELQALLDDPQQVRRTLGLDEKAHDAATYRKALAYLRQDIGQLLWRELNI